MTAGLNARCHRTMTVAMDRHTPHEPEVAAALQHAIALLEARSDHLRANASEIRARGGVPDLVEAAAEEAERHATTLRRLLGD
jgi:hypothetical protein